MVSLPDVGCQVRLELQALGTHTKSCVCAEAQPAFPSEQMHFSKWSSLCSLRSGELFMPAVKHRGAEMEYHTHRSKRAHQHTHTHTKKNTDINRAHVYGGWI